MRILYSVCLITFNSLMSLLMCRRLIPVSETYDGASFFTIENGKRVATPLLLVLAVVELSDVVFAVDSIPAVSAALFCNLSANKLCYAISLALLGALTFCLVSIRLAATAGHPCYGSSGTGMSVVNCSTVAWQD